MTVAPMPAPDSVHVWSVPDGPPLASESDSETNWSTGGIQISLTPGADGLRVTAVAERTGLSRIALRWNEGIPERSLVLGDAWERSYGDLGWAPARPERILPWYWLSESAQGIRGAGVRVRPGAMAFWTVDSAGVTLWLDTRSGSSAVHLGERTLEVATVVGLRADEGSSAFSAQQELCAALCSDPIQMTQPLVGCNNWYYAYGENFDADAVVRDAAMISVASDGHSVRPFCVIDAGWSHGSSGAPGGPWIRGADSFDNMSAVADRIRAEGARPGLWFRPLLTRDQSMLTRNSILDGEWPMDPSREHVLEQVKNDAACFVEWGYDLIKHDFSTFDTLGHFVPGTDLGMERVPWSFADQTRTSAEVFVGLYQAVRDGAAGATLIGCNTIGHLSAGLVDAQRTGDDTSGRHWERTRRMGINTLAFRLAQHKTFFTVDADCVAATPSTPWEKNRQFLDLVAQSGTALFVSIDPRSRDAKVDDDVRRAIRVASDGGAPGGIEPLDWQWTSAPQRWRINDSETEYRWNQPWSADLRLD